MTHAYGDRLGIIAGGGQLPQLLVEACITQQRPYTVVALKDQADNLAEPPSLWVRLGQAGKCFRKFQKDGVASVVMAGKVKRPSLLGLRPDWRTIQFLARAGIRAFTNKTSVGDDRLLRSVIAEVEREGFQVVGVESILSGLLAEVGAIGAVAPSIEDQHDIGVGVAAAKEHGTADMGQAVVARDGAVIAVEGLDGTDAMVRAVTCPIGQGRGPVLVKVSKPQQDRRADLPVIGPETVANASAAGFRGIVIEAGGTLVLDRDKVALLANQAGMFVVAVATNALSGCGDE